MCGYYSEQQHEEFDVPVGQCAHCRCILYAGDSVITDGINDTMFCTITCAEEANPSRQGPLTEEEHDYWAMKAAEDRAESEGLRMEARMRVDTIISQVITHAVDNHPRLTMLARWAVQGLDPNYIPF